MGLGLGLGATARDSEMRHGARGVQAHVGAILCTVGPTLLPRPSRLTLMLTQAHTLRTRMMWSASTLMISHGAYRKFPTGAKTSLIEVSWAWSASRSVRSRLSCAVSSRSCLSRARFSAALYRAGLRPRASGDLERPGDLWRCGEKARGGERPRSRTWRCGPARSAREGVRVAGSQLRRCSSVWRVGGLL